MDAHPRSRSFLLAVAVVAGGGALMVGCGAASQARDEVVAGLTDGTWNCVDDGGTPNLSIEADDGSFQLRTTKKGDEGETAPGSWKVIDKDIRASLSTDGAKEIYDVRGFDDLKAKAGTITVQDPKDADLTATFEVDVKGTDTVAITPDDQSAKEFPSGTWNCERQ